MHKEILSKEQLQLLPLLKAFSNEYNLVGGTAIALYLGHRQSIDFDLFSDKSKKNEKLFREQLSYFEDLDHSEEIRYQGIELQDDEIKKYLQDIATEEF